LSIKAVVFDFGNVISFPPPPEAGEKLAEAAGIPLELLKELDRKHRGEFDRGRYTGAEYYKFILAEVGVFLDEQSLQNLAEIDMGGWKNMNPVTVALMRDIKAAGFTLGILSNMPHEFLVWARQNIPIFGEADQSVFSCEYDLVKPETAIYEKLKEKLGYEYGEIVFFDDLADNIKKARELGIHGFVFTDPQAAREELKRLDGAFETL
jgi:putative hydrolase of the HAD superfamily